MAALISDSTVMEKVGKSWKKMSFLVCCVCGQQPDRKGGWWMVVKPASASVLAYCLGPFIQDRILNMLTIYFLHYTFSHTTSSKMSERVLSILL